MSVQAELLKLQKIGQFPDEPVRIKRNTYWVDTGLLFIIQSIKRELKRRPRYECRCDERLKTGLRFDGREKKSEK